MVARPGIRRQVLLRIQSSLIRWRRLLVRMMLRKIAAKHRKKLTAQRALWGFFATRMLMHERCELSNVLLKVLLRNRSTRIRKIQAYLSATERTACEERAEDHVLHALERIFMRLQRAQADIVRRDVCRQIVSLYRELNADIELAVPKCIICLDKYPNIVMLCPNNHQCLCADYFAELFPPLPRVLQIAQERLCLTCRSPFTGHMGVHLP
jgi:hypothetical protein